MGRFIQYYRENAKYLERTYAFVERIGIERIRAVVVGGQREASARGWMRRSRPRSTPMSIPGRRRRARKTANQFANLIPVED